MSKPRNFLWLLGRSSSHALLFALLCMTESTALWLAPPRTTFAREFSLGATINFGGSNKAPALTFSDRVSYQRAIEDVYWRHRIWPKENSRPKPSLNEVMPSAVIEKKVEDYLRTSQALEDYWHKPITAEQLRAEMERINRNTQQPEVLHEIFEALGNDPLVIGECLARPTLVERLVAESHFERESYRGEFGKASKNEGVGRAPSRAELLDVRGPKLVSRMTETNSIATTALALPTVSSVSTNGCTDNTWSATSISNAPPQRESHTAVWTGSEMIVWGGTNDDNFGTNALNTGGRYVPSTDSWTATSTTNAPEARFFHTAIWTEMIVWGGRNSGGTNSLNTGGKYNPGSDTWTATNTTNAPAARYVHTAVWTGSQMIIWGGWDYPNVFRDGGTYNPSTDSWAGINTANAPAARGFHTSVWTGNEMIVWGGADSSNNNFNTGGRYNAVSDTWTASTTTNAPIARRWHTAIWTGSEMVVWGGSDNNFDHLQTGGRFNPATNSWTAVSTANAPAARSFHTSVWTGNEMIVWGGVGNVGNNRNTGGRYNPSSDGWTGTGTTGAPDARSYHTAVWTGTEMVIWGGYTTGTENTGGRYCSQPALGIERVVIPAGRTSGGQQIRLAGIFAGLSSVMMGGAQASWFYTNGSSDTSSITVTTPAHTVGAVQIDLTPTSGAGSSKANAFAYLPTIFTDDTIVVGQTTAKAQHIIELRQAVDALRAVAGLSGAPWTDPALAPGGLIKATHIIELRMYLDDAATRLGYSTLPYTDPGLTSGFMIKRIHIEELRQRIRTIAGP
jgi:N-acetylneuraminic acid mutarotase